MKPTLVAIALIFSLHISAHASQLRGQITDTAGAVIPKAHVVIHWDSVGLDAVKENVGIAEDEVLTTDDLGQFTTELPPGVYDIFTASSGFQPTCAKLVIARNKVKLYEVHLKGSRMLTIQLE